MCAWMYLCVFLPVCFFLCVRVRLTTALRHFSMTPPTSFNALLGSHHNSQPKHLWMAPMALLHPGRRAMNSNFFGCKVSRLMLTAFNPRERRRDTRRAERAIPLVVIANVDTWRKIESKGSFKSNQFRSNQMHSPPNKRVSTGNQPR